MQQSAIWRDGNRQLNSDFYHCSEKVNPDTLFHAVSAFGHLVRTNEQITPDQFARRIERAYCRDNPRTASVLQALRACN